ncbi:MAG: class I SAM-dependent RNA methyltransferase [Planctomycetota bacterium]|nr:class I SAM-dependent RNA methyltransferase [Planctomycetota bacterium]
MTQFQAFAVCPPGLERLLATELRGIDLSATTEMAGGVAFECDLDGLYRANLEAGLASQILLRISEFGARSLADLDKRGARIDWSQWLPRGIPVVVKASCKRSRIYHSGAAEERVLKHLSEQLEPSESDATPVLVRVRIDDNRCQISLDSSGEPLHRRGWRLQSGKAPLREDLARALLLASGWDRRSPLIDPMMGSGTILIEAAAMARGLAPGRMRTFAIEKFGIHDPQRLVAIRDSAAQRALSDLPFKLFGSDRDAGALEATSANAERAGVIEDLQLRRSSLSGCLDDLEGDAVHALVTNPPYGKRLGNADELITLYQVLGKIVGQLTATSCVAVAANDRRLALRSGLKLKTGFSADSGGSRIRALVRV